MRTRITLISSLAILILGLAACDESSSNIPVSASGVTQASVKVSTGSDGLTTEQRNIGQRIHEDNKPGSIKHLYVISAYSGQVIIYSTVRGKVTSGGKRLTPTSVATSSPNTNARDGIPVFINGVQYRTGEVIQDDGTYGTSGDYFFWWDTKSVYHQQYASSGVVIHISDQPLAVKGIVINMEISQKPSE
jgi:hypothetical protein